MNGAAQQEPAVQESDLLKAIGDLEEAANLQKAETEPVPRDYMDSTRSARGGSAQVLDSGPGSRENLIPEGHDDPANFDMTAASGSRAEMGKGYKGSKAKKKDDDDDYDDDKGKKKSMRKALDDRPTVKKAVEVSRFLEELVDTQADSHDKLAKAVYESDDLQKAFNGRLAKAVVAIGNTVEELRKAVAELSDQPAGTRKSVLSKSEDLLGREFDDPNADHHQPPGDPQIQKADVLDYLCEKAEAQEIPPEAVTEFELHDRLPPNIAADVKNHFAATA